MLTESSLFFLNLCNKYSELRETKVTSGISEEWVKQIATTKPAKCQWVCTESSDDYNATTMPKATFRATNRPSKKRINNLGIAVIAHEQALSLKKIHKGSASTSGESKSEKMHNEEPNDFQNSFRYGGLKDEDDEEKWRVIEQSLAKQGLGVRISDHVRCRYACSWTPNDLY